MIVSSVCRKSSSSTYKTPRSWRAVFKAATAATLGVLIGLAESQNASAQLMTLPGNFDVVPSGAATYTVAISVPPGTAGMVPALSFEYNSQAGDGIMGIGWSLAGLPAISRCPQTVVQDGVAGGVNYDMNDRYCMDGHRLVVVPGTGSYGSDGSIYHTEIETFSQVIAHGAQGNGPAWFEVHTKSGQVMEFGRTADSQVFAQGKTTTRAWSLNKTYDTVGNYFTVAYDVDSGNGVSFPARIDYTGNGSTAPSNSVQFTYGLRVSPAPAFHAGSMQNLLYVLTEVKTYAGATLVADYKLAYQHAGVVPVNQLTSITLCGGDGACLPATTFQNANGGPGTFNAGSLTIPNGWNFGGTPGEDFFSLTGDFNGDGKSDYAMLQGALLYIFISNGDGSFAASTYPIPNGWNFGYPGGAGGAVGGCGAGGCIGARPPANSCCSLVSGDFNGDGKADFAMVGDTVIYVFLSNGDGTFAASAYPIPNGWAFGAPASKAWVLFAGDLNADGRTDIFLLQGSTLHAFLSRGDGTFTPTTFSTAANGWNFGSPSDPGFAFIPISGDFDGDGKIDFAMIAEAGVYMFRSNGDGSFRLSFWPMTVDFGPPNQFWTPFTGDFNGDGKADFGFIGNSSLYTFFSRGDGTFQGTGWGIPGGWNFGQLTSNFTLLTGDFNGDGKTDLLALSSTIDYQLLSNGDGSYAQQAYFIPNGWAFGSPQMPSWLPLLGDFNGDGLSDYAMLQRTTLYSFLAAGEPGFHVNTVTTGLGAATSVTYLPLTNGNVYSKETGSIYPVQDMEGPVYVVQRADMPNGVGGIYSATYYYRGGKVDLAGRGFLGFRQMETVDLQTGIDHAMIYRQDFPFIGMVSQDEKLNNRALNNTVFTYQFVNVNGIATLSAPSIANAPYRVSVAQSVAASTDLDGSVLPAVTTTYQYDAYGNATQVVTSTPDGYSKTTTSTYVNDTTHWFLGRLTGATVTSTTP